jgi:hypothetical protein
MDGCDHSDCGPLPADPRRAADAGGRAPETAVSARRDEYCDDTAFHEPNNWDGAGKDRRAAPWPFLIRRLG